MPRVCSYLTAVYRRIVSCIFPSFPSFFFLLSSPSLREPADEWVVVRFNGLRVSVYEVESHLCDLPYIVEGYVLSIPDSRYGHRVGALVVLGAGKASLTLGNLRKDLAAALAIYKLPTVLRVVDRNEELPRSPEGKLSRNPALQRFFPTENDELSGKVEVWDLGVEEMATKRAWDWGGVV